MALKCFYYDVTQLADRELFAKGLSGLFWSKRAERVSRYRFDKDKRLCLGAGLLAQDMLRAAGADDLTIAYDQYGKPCLANHPHIHFNISHDGDIAVCAAGDVPAGVDVQKLTPYDRDIAAMVMLPEEIGYITAQEDTAAAFTGIWTRKESFVKLYGRGLSQDMKSFSVLPPEARCGSAYFHEYRVGDHLICLCCEGVADVQFGEWKYR